MAPRKTSSNPPPRGRREHRKHLTRRELLAAGRRLFAEKGLYDSRIADLSRQAGIAKGTLYLYFGNKEELVDAVVTNGFNELLGQVHRAAQDARSREDAVARVTEAHLAFFEDNPDLMRIFHQVRGLLKFDGARAQPLRGALAKYLTGLAQVLALHPPARPPHGTSDLDVAMLLFGAISGITSVRASMNRPAPGSRNSRVTLRGLVGLIRAFEDSQRGSAERRSGAQGRLEPGRRGRGPGRIRRTHGNPGPSRATGAPGRR